MGLADEVRGRQAARANAALRAAQERANKADLDRQATISAIAEVASEVAEACAELNRPTSISMPRGWIFELPPYNGRNWNGTGSPGFVLYAVFLADGRWHFARNRMRCGKSRRRNLGGCIELCPADDPGTRWPLLPNAEAVREMVKDQLDQYVIVLHLHDR